MDIVIAVAVLAGLYLVPQLAPNRRWLAALAGLAAAGGLIYWSEWVARQGDPFAYAVAAMTVILCWMAAAMGIAVRALVLWRGWQGGRMAATVGIGCAVLVAGMTIMVGVWR